MFCLSLLLAIDAITAQDAQLGPAKVNAGIKGKLPTGWSSKLKLTSEQKTTMYAESAKFQQKILDIRDEEYRAMYKMLTDGQKKVLKAQILD